MLNNPAQLSYDNTQSGSLERRGGKNANVFEFDDSVQDLRKEGCIEELKDV